MSVRTTWAAMFEPERYPPPPLGGAAIAVRYTLALLWYFVVIGSWVFISQGGLESLPPGDLTFSIDDPSMLPPRWFMVADGVLGAIGLVLVRFRRSHPLPVYLALTFFSLAAPSLGVVVVWVTLSVASRRHLPTLAVVFATAMAQGLIEYSYPWTPPFAWEAFLSSSAMLIGIILIGMYIGVRRDRAATFVHRVEQAESDRAYAVLAERNRIAREMHDVLAHRISLVSMHAGVLGYRTDLTPEKTREVARIIQENAHASLTELRSVLSTLREIPEVATASALEAVQAPQPTLADLPSLLAEAEASGQRLFVTTTLDAAAVPLVQQRHLYRIAQECLTNARKHAPRSSVRLHLSGTPRDGIALRVENAVTDIAGGIPGARLGVVGITERAHMLGGHAEIGVRGGSFVVEVWVPWQSDFRRRSE